MLVLVPILGGWAWGRALVVLLACVTMMFALHTSRVGTGSAASRSAEWTRSIQAGLVVLLTFATLVAIVARVGTHPTVSGSTVFAALCIYLLIGWLYASTFAFVNTLSSTPVLKGAGSGPLTSVDFLYFSYVTLTTVGYGDVTATQDFTRMMAVSEALLGQLYLVTIVAIVVSNIGRARRTRDG
jgi:Ion channel/Protein of unknown function (DUF1345)